MNDVDDFGLVFDGAGKSYVKRRKRGVENNSVKGVFLDDFAYFLAASGVF